MDDREAVKKLLELDDRTLRRFGAGGLDNHRDVAQHYAAGGDIQMRMLSNTRWIDTHEPSFHSDLEYRIKPESDDKSIFVCVPDLRLNKLQTAVSLLPDNVEHVSAVKRGGEWIVYYSEGQ